MENTSTRSKGNTAITAGPFGSVDEMDVKILRKVKRILDRGNNAEIKKRKDGSVTVYEVKKSII